MSRTRLSPLRTKWFKRIERLSAQQQRSLFGKVFFHKVPIRQTSTWLWLIHELQLRLYPIGRP
jgi:hypothetical protein